AHLGETFDIHGGGQDLIFPHHENEIAQSTCAHDGAPFVRHWMHNGYLTVNGEKMSKSLGNFFTVRDLLEQAPGEAIRFYMLLTHYRQPFDWTLEGLNGARQALNRLYTALWHAGDMEAEIEPSREFMAALEDDLNTPLAISHLHALATALNKAEADEERKRLKGALLAGGDLLGVLTLEAEDWLKWRPEGRAAEVDEQALANLIALRLEARKEKNYTEADRIREELKAKGIVLEDTPGGTTWRRAG
ncbi:MAG: DALR domain-containing protein, partial [Alphaproteobacteria bacterium]